MAKILFCDTECSSLDTQNGFIQELAWAVYEIESKRLLRSKSYIIHWGRAYEVDEGALATTGLTREFCEAHGIPARFVFEEFLLDLSMVDAVCGHNYIDYDKEMLISNIKRTTFVDPSPKISKPFTFDTMYDCPITNPRQVMALKYLAFDLGFAMTNAHQAMADVFACAHIFFSFPFEKLTEIACTPLMTVHGYTQWGDEAGRDAFYKNKFKWNRDRKRWERRARAYYIPGTQLELGDRQMFTTKEDQELKVNFKPVAAKVEESVPAVSPCPEHPEIPF